MVGEEIICSTTESGKVCRR